MCAMRLNPLLVLTVAAFAAAPDLAGAAVEISQNATANMACSGGTCTPTAKKAILNVTELANMLSSGNVTVSSGNLARDVEIDAALNWTSASRLTLDSYRSIAFNKPVVVAGTGALTITTNHGGSGGDFRFFKKGHVEFWDLESSLVINGSTYGLVKNIKKLQAAIRHNGHGDYALASSISAKNHAYSSSPIAGFSGNFDGLGNTISHLTINNSSGAEQIGFFGELMSFATVRDVGLVAVNIDGGDAKMIGGLVGFLSSGPAIRNSYASGQISSGGDSFIGGLVGKSFLSTVSDSYAEVSVSAHDSAKAAGGLIGFLEGDFDGAVESSHAAGPVTGGDSTSVGGLVGYSSGGVVNNCYAIGEVSGGSNALVGGLIGSSTDSDFHSNPIVAQAYATGSVSGGSGATIGGLIGQDAADSEITDSYWDMQTSGISDPHQGAGNIGDDEGITGLTTEQFKSGLPAGFLGSVWAEKTKLNDGYPYLLDNPPPK